ncbi:DUF3142 domain-containing protein [Novosphingobium album (ex Liu et al. 2023)]|uniref:DUF3142 domain-containing protein n=1 Tax=Novosphingobium album (ex Liu et al. 2023) TaxID=3031130 RepID=A0ABT5WTE4_9SPHN|nr:DUF3142 domain-containing protein [Novosphingobium album (ex Liu et al. 2023)]MDE8653052.1 DUF3142 domain-containing protein [Novosphingobium album (ex Liu et al. 2023)]
MVTRRALLAGLLGTAALAACRRRQPAARATRVDPRDHAAFFLWAGVRAPDWLGAARTVYLLAGEVPHRDPPRFVPLRAVPRVRGPQVWLTVRVERLDWPEAVTQTVLQALARWEMAGNRLVGLQVDFDAATRGLAGYAAFLARLRARLPQRWRLSITGLLDWSAGGDPAALARLAGVVDEIVVQTYQGRRTIPGYEAYLRGLRTLPIPFRVALVEGGAWREPPGLAAQPNFRGYVVFLLPPR